MTRLRAQILRDLGVTSIRLGRAKPAVPLAGKETEKPVGRRRSIP
jgi:hypothetical protein